MYHQGFDVLTALDMKSYILENTTLSSLLTFRRNTSPPSSDWKNKRRVWLWMRHASADTLMLKLPCNKRRLRRKTDPSFVREKSPFRNTSMSRREEKSWAWISRRETPGMIVRGKVINLNQSIEFWSHRLVVLNCIVRNRNLATTTEQTQDMCAVVLVIYRVCKLVRLLTIICKQ
jgi:hypothetical protein